jgi:oligoribonuclease NrnB/cAMP/cGMP phosphodiesterase (DHH superfamily)
MLDFSVPRNLLLLLAESHEVWVLDHHKTAKADLEGLDHPKLHITFDMDKSGAVLAWEFFHPDTEVPWFLQYVQDRDLWNWQLPHSKSINSTIGSCPREFLVWDAWLGANELNILSFVEQGEAIQRMKDRFTEQLIEDPRVGLFHIDKDGKLEVIAAPTINAPSFLASEAAYAILNKYPRAPFAAVYRDVGNGERHWSLRSMEGRMDVSEVAKRYGGGGHRNAAGFHEAMAFASIGFSGYSWEDLKKEVYE